MLFLQILQFCNKVAEIVLSKNAGLRQLYQKENPKQVFSCEYCQIFKSSIFLWNTYYGPYYDRFYFQTSMMELFLKKKATSLRANFIKRGFEIGAFLGILCNSLEYILTFILRKHNKMIMRQKLQNCLNCLTLS